MNIMKKYFGIGYNKKGNYGIKWIYFKTRKITISLVIEAELLKGMTKSKMIERTLYTSFVGLKTSYRIFQKKKKAEFLRNEREWNH